MFARKYGRYKRLDGFVLVVMEIWCGDKSDGVARIGRDAGISVVFLCVLFAWDVCPLIEGNARTFWGNCMRKESSMERHCKKNVNRRREEREGGGNYGFLTF